MTRPGFDQALDRQVRAARKVLQRAAAVLFVVGLVLTVPVGLLVNDWLAVVGVALGTVVTCLLVLGRPPNVPKALRRLQGRNPPQWLETDSHGLLAISDGRVVGKDLTDVRFKTARYLADRHALKLTGSAAVTVQLDERSTAAQAQAFVEATGLPAK